MGNTSANTFSTNLTANGCWESKCGKYKVLRLNIGRGFKITLANGGPTPRGLHGMYLKQEVAIQAIDVYDAHLALTRPQRVRTQELAAAARAEVEAEAIAEDAAKEAAKLEAAVAEKASAAKVVAKPVPAKAVAKKASK